ncbi:MAG: alpha/beta hydrolase [Isosphaeraceae bacterium]
MSVVFRTMGTSRGRRFVARGLRILGWVGLVGATAWLVRAEPRRALDPPGVRVVRDLVYRTGRQGKQAKLDLLLPAAPTPARGWPVLVAVHGGAWRGGSKSDYGASLADLVRSGIAVLAIDYQLSRPGQPSWPENLADVRAAVRWVDVEAARYQLDSTRKALIGASAGAHLALLAALGPAGGDTVTARNASRSQAGESIGVAAVIDFYGPTSLADLTDARPSVDLMLGEPRRPDRYETASPVRCVRPGVPPVLILHGSSDRLVPIDQSIRLAEALDRAGVAHRFIRVDEARHGFGLQAGTRDFVPEILAFLGSAWNDEMRPSSLRDSSNESGQLGTGLDP